MTQYAPLDQKLMQLYLLDVILQIMLLSKNSNKIIIRGTPW